MEVVVVWSKLLENKNFFFLYFEINILGRNFKWTFFKTQDNPVKLGNAWTISYFCNLYNCQFERKKDVLAWVQMRKYKLGNKINQKFLGMLNENESSLIHRPVYFIFLTPLIFKRFMNQVWCDCWDCTVELHILSKLDLLPEVEDCMRVSIPRHSCVQCIYAQYFM